MKVDAAQSRHFPVRHDDVVAVAADQLEGGGTGGGGLDAVPVGEQHLFYEVPDGVFVVDHQHAQAGGLERRGGIRPDPRFVARRNGDGQFDDELGAGARLAFRADPAPVF